MASVFDEMLQIAGKLDIPVRHAHLGGNGGGLARVKDQRLLFVDLDADPADQIDQTARGLSGLPELDALFIRPDVRQLLDEAKSPPPGKS